MGEAVGTTPVKFEMTVGLPDGSSPLLVHATRNAAAEAAIATQNL